MWASSHSTSLMPTALAMSRAKRATAAEWRAARWSRMSSERIRPARTPQESDTYCWARWRERSNRWVMYENANTPASANAIPAFPTFSVIPTPASTTSRLRPPLGRNSSSVRQPYCSASGKTRRRSPANIAKLRTSATEPASATAT